MKRNVKKLAFEKSVIRALSSSQLDGAAGGQTMATCSELCSEVRCPDTQFVHGCNSSGWTR